MLMMLFKLYIKCQEHTRCIYCAAYHHIDKKHKCLGDIIDSVSTKAKCKNCPYCVFKEEL